MTSTLYAQVDEQGRLILPPQLVEQLRLSAGNQLLVKPDGFGIRLRSPITVLRRAYIEITNRCNLSCSTCMRNVWDVQYGQMTMQMFERILADLGSFSPQPEIFFGGYGEPLSHPQCLDMVARAKSLGLQVSLITNGILLNEDVCWRLIDLELDRLWVSLDGASPECYLDVRLGNRLPEIIENLKRLRSLQLRKFGFNPAYLVPRLGIAFVAMRRNIQDLPAVIRLGSLLGAIEYSITNVLAHNASLREEVLYTRSLYQMHGPNARQWQPLVHIPSMDMNSLTGPVLIELLKSDHRLDLTGNVIGRDGDQCPFVERGSLSIRWDGKVSPCLPLLYTHTYYLDDRQRTSKEYFAGDLQSNTLADIWNDENYLALRKNLQEFDFSPCTVCNSCEMADENREDCFGNTQPACGGCLWAQGLIHCP